MKSERTPLKEYLYNSDGRLWKTIDLVSAVTLAEYGYDKAGRQIWTKNANDVYTANEYDSQYGRLVRVNYGVTTLSDDYTDGEASTPETLGATDETYVRYVYDDDGRKREEWRPEDGGLSPLEICTYYDYDDQGRQTKIIYNYQDGVTGPGSATDAIYETVYNKYGERTAIIDATGHYTWFEYDDFGRLWRKILDKDGDQAAEPGSDDIYEEYTYDLGRGLLLKKRNYDGSEIQYEYDNLTDRKVKGIYPDGLESHYSYDNLSGRLTSVEECENGVLRRTTSYTYDPATGRPALVANPDGRMEYQYDELGNLSRVAECSGRSGVEYEYFYDDLGRLEQVRTPSGMIEYDYYPTGSRKSLKLANGVYTEYVYDNLLHLDRMKHWKSDSKSTLLAEFNYAVGRSGKRLSVSENIDGNSVTIDYAYDRLGRLTGADRTSGADCSYSYDIVGNRLSKTVGATTTTYQYNPLDQLTHEVVSGATTSYTYDGNGNLTKKEWDGGQTNYIYDWCNKLRKVYNGAVSGLPDLEYAYDHAGNRFAKAERVGVSTFDQTDFLIDTNNLTGYSQTLLEIDHNTGAIDKRYEYGDDLYCQVTSPETPNPTAHFFLYDGLGSTRSLTDPGGAITQTYNYLPFGETINPPPSYATNHLFTGEYFDSNLSYYYLRARYYDPSVGRFTSYDPMEDFNNRLHKYAYCGNDPTNFIDPLGQMTLITLVLAAALFALIAGIGRHFCKSYRRGLLAYDPNKYRNKGYPEIEIEEIHDIIRDHGEPYDVYWDIDESGNIVPIPGVRTLLIGVDWAAVRDELYARHEPEGAPKEPGNYILSDGITLVSFDKFYHFTAGAQVAAITGGFGEFGNLIYEVWATRPGTFQYWGIPALEDNNKSYVRQDVIAGGYGEHFQQAIELFAVEYYDFDISDYFDKTENWLGD